MAKTPSKDLFYLIHSLTSSEKRYISVSLSKESRGGKNIHLTLFEQINKQETYDENKLTKLKELDFGKNLTSRKGYLFALILKKLDAFHMDSDEGENIIFRYIQHAKILLSKSLLKACMNYLAKAEALAEEREELHLLILVYQVKKRAAKLLYPSFKEYNEYVNEVIAAENDLVDKIKSLHHYVYLYSRLKIILTQSGGNVLGEKEQEELDSIITPENFDSEDKATTLLAKIAYQNSLAIYEFWVKKDIGAAFVHFHQIFQYIEQIPNYVQNNIHAYLFNVSKYIYCAYILKKGKMAQPAYEQLKSLFYSTDFDNHLLIKGHIFRYYINIEMLILYQLKDFQGIHKIIPVIDKEFPKYRKVIDQEPAMVLMANAGIILMIAGDYKKALKWLLAVIDMKATTRKDITDVSRFQLLICLYEMDDVSLFESYLRSFRRHYNNRKGHFDFEKELLNRFKLLFLKKHESDQILPLFIDAAKFMAQHMLSEKSKQNFDIKELAYWAATKIKNMDFETIMATYQPKEIYEELVEKY
jgi:hypothetical protein